MLQLTAAPVRKRGPRFSGSNDAYKLPTPIALQRLARPMVRRHVLRSATRLGALLVGDVITLGLIRLVVRGLRDHGWMGATVAGLFGELVPQGMYPPLQLLAAIVLGLGVFGTYASGDLRRHPARLTAGVTLAFALMFWGHIWTDFTPAALLGFALTTVAASASVIATRLLIDAAVRNARPVGRARTLFVSAPGEGESDMSVPMFRNNREIDIVGHLATGQARESGAVGHLDEIIEVIRRHSVDTIIISGSVDHATFQTAVDAGTSAGCEVFAVPRPYRSGLVRPQFVWRRGLPLIQLTRPSLKGRQLLLKRSLDIALASALLVALAPLFLLVALLIKLSSCGPVFFRQERVGYGGKRFHILKFRTMRPGADEMKAQLASLNHTSDPRLFKIPNDPRVTRIGKLLRAWSLDELPQLINVLLGQMSLVGPRPFFASDLEAYQEHHFHRLGAKPGITGLWQVSGRSAVVDFEEVVRLDQDYIDRWSPWLDLVILCRTVPAVVRRRGAF